MFIELSVLGIVAAMASVVLTGLVRRYALRSNLLDVPNARSSHVAPTPRGGGLAIAMVFCAGIAGLGSLGLVSESLVVAALPALLAVAVVGFVDDRRGLSPLVRILVHVVAVAWFLTVGEGLPRLGIAWLDAAPALAFPWILVSVLWLVNLFNFMDGIDGLAGAEAILVAVGLAVVGYMSGHGTATILCSVLLAAATSGFLMWNWPPAKIFMGDIGSGFVGLALGIIALLAVRECLVSAWVPAILLAAFTVDATLTLVRRVLRGDRWVDAHRTHAYQWLSRRWHGHRPVVFSLVLVNILWLMPLALLAQQEPDFAGRLALAAYLPLVGLAIWAGSGRQEA